MKLTLALSVSATALSASTWPVVVAASREERSLQNNNKNNNVNTDKWDKNQQTATNTEVTSNGRSWSTTDDCNCWEYLTNDYWHYSPFWDGGWKDHHHAHMAEFCCEFTAELADPTCPDWENGGFPNAPIEKMICDIFKQDMPERAVLKRQARDACYCYYRGLGCNNDLLLDGGYCNYPTNEVVLDDFRFANSSLINMCNNCLEDRHTNEKDYPRKYPYYEGRQYYEGHSFNQCLGYCFLKRGDPNRVFKPTVKNHQCCLDTHGQGLGLKLHGYESKTDELRFFPTLTKEDFNRDGMANEWTYDNMYAPGMFNVIINYDGVDTATMEVEKPNNAVATYMIDEFNVDCAPGQWDSLNIHVYDESSEGGIAFTNVWLDSEQLGDFGFAVKDSCPVYIKPDVIGTPGDNHTCVTRPGGYGHVAGFTLTGTVVLQGTFQGGDIGLALTVGCSQPKEAKESGCCAKKEVPTAWAAW